MNTQDTPAIYEGQPRPPTERGAHVQHLRRLVRLAGRHADAGNNKQAQEILGQVRKLGVTWGIRPNEIGGNWSEW